MGIEQILYHHTEPARINYKTFNAVGVRNKIFLTEPSFTFKGSNLSAYSTGLFQKNKFHYKKKLKDLSS